jgi:protein-tyrosine phosphatase
MTKVRVLFVCLGNICRSPTAEGIFRSKVAQAGLEDKLYIDSAGTGDWHIGRAPDSRAQEYAAQAGYDLSNLRGRLVSADDFACFDYVLAMDKQNLLDLQAMQPSDFDGHLGLFLDFDTRLPIDEVPDPYSMGGPAFRNAIQLIERGCDALIEDIQTRLQQPS